MLIGLVGKPSAGKSTFFKALTLINVKIASYPFTTIEPNRGVAFVKAKCPHSEIGKQCNPNNSGCDNGTRLIPVKILDVAGLVPGAHLGRGRGNKFLDDLRQANALIHIVDMSGNTDENGLPAEKHDPLEDIKWLEEEIELWIAGIIEKAGAKADESAIIKQLSGFTSDDKIIRQCAKESGSNLEKLARLVRQRTKPMLIAANKMDLPAAGENFARASGLVENMVSCSAELEIVLRLAKEKGLARCDNSELIVSEKANDLQRQALEKAGVFLKKYGSTGVQECLEYAVVNLLDQVEVYPVENENNWTDSRGRILPDVYLVPNGTTAKEFAAMIHTDLAKNFITAIDARRKMKVKDDYILKKGDVIKIVAGK